MSTRSQSPLPLRRPILMAATALVAAWLGTLPAMAQRAAVVGVDAVQEDSVSQTVPVIGRLVSRRAGVIAARVGGPVQEVRVFAGDRVKRGDVLAVLVLDRLRWERERRAADVAERRARLAAQESEVTMKSQELERLDRLRSSRSAAFRQAQFDDKQIEAAMLASHAAEARARLQQAEADLQLAELNLEYAHIRAPFDGVVTLKHTEAGAYLNVGAPVVTMINDIELEIEADVPADRLQALDVGAPVDLTISKVPAQAKVRAIIPEENPLTRTRAVRFTPVLNGVHGLLAANQSVTVRIPISAAKTVVSVHKDAILTQQNKNLVYVVVDGKAELRPIRIGDAVGGRFIVEDGLQPGDVVVIRGNERLRPGQDVMVPGSNS